MPTETSGPLKTRFGMIGDDTEIILVRRSDAYKDYLRVQIGEAPRIVAQMSPENVAWVDARDEVLAVLQRWNDTRCSACLCDDQEAGTLCLDCATAAALAAAVGPEPEEAEEGNGEKETRAETCQEEEKAPTSSAAQITKDPCAKCHGAKGETDPCNSCQWYSCYRCGGTGIEPDEPPDESEAAGDNGSER